MNKLTSIYKTHQEMFSYLFFGAATTLINWSLYSLLVHLAGVGITVGNAVAWIGAVIFAFFTNKIFVFKSRSWQPLLVLREGGAFLGARAVSGLIELTGVPALYHLGFNYLLFGIEGFAAKVTVSVIVIILNYHFSKFVIFRRKK